MAKKTEQKRPLRERLSEGRVATLVRIVAAYMALMLLCMMTMSPERYDLKAGDIAKKTITASKDILDGVNTERRKEAAANAVTPVYYKDESVSQVVLTDLEETFEELHAVQELGAQWNKAAGDGTTPAYTDTQYVQAGTLLTKVTLSNYQLSTLLGSSAQDLDDLYQSLQSAMRTTLIGTIPEGQENDAFTNIQQLVAFNTRSDLWWNVATPVLRACIQANMKIDQEATEENRQKAMEEVEPVYYKQGENIVIKGDRVTESQIAVLASLGLITGEKFDMQLYAGTGLVLLILMGMFICYCMLVCREEMAKSQNQTILLIVAALHLGLCVALSQINASLMPIALGALVITVAISPRTALAYNVMLSLVLVLLGIKGSGLVPAHILATLLRVLASGTIAVFVLRRRSSRNSRSGLLRAGLYVGLINAVILVCVGLLTSSDLASSLLYDAGYALAGGIISAILCVGIMPVLEAMFNLTTPTKLLELANPNHPILRKLMIEAPGTYHHSVIVANIAEAAAEEIGANALLVRVGAYYHDIGKLKRPIYFKENQMGENPHDHTDPRVSAQILIEHPRDGVLMAQKGRLPQPVIDMIRQHHGDTLVMFFYHKAVQMYGEESIQLEDFRYDGPKPQTAEAAVLMLADTVEAAVRAMPDPTPEKIREMIRKLVRGKVDDGQLDESPLTFRDVEQVCEAFGTVLNGVFHERIEYPDVKVPSRAMDVQKKKDAPQEAQSFLPTEEEKKLLEQERQKKREEEAQAAREKAEEAARAQQEEVAQMVKAQEEKLQEAAREAETAQAQPEEATAEAQEEKA